MPLTMVDALHRVVFEQFREPDCPERKFIAVKWFLLRFAPVPTQGMITPYGEITQEALQLEVCFCVEDLVFEYRIENIVASDYAERRPGNPRRVINEIERKFIVTVEQVEEIKREAQFIVNRSIGECF